MAQRLFEHLLRTFQAPMPLNLHLISHLWPLEIRPSRNLIHNWDRWGRSMEAQVRIRVFPRCLCHRRLLKLKIDDVNKLISNFTKKSMNRRYLSLVIHGQIHYEIFGNFCPHYAVGGYGVLLVFHRRH